MSFSFVAIGLYIQPRKRKSVAFEHLFHKFNDTLENSQEYIGYRILEVDGSDFSSLYSADSEYATISNQYDGANRMHINFAYDILNKNFLDCVIEAKNKADERKNAVTMLSSLAESEKILAIMDRGFDGVKMIEHCNRIENLSYLIRVRSTKMNEIVALPDEELDLDLKFEVRTQSKRLPYKMKIRAWDMDLPCTVSFRLVKVKLKDKWLVLATNLPRKDFPAHKLKKLYEKRWKIELAFRDIKHALGSLHSYKLKLSATFNLAITSRRLYDELTQKIFRRSDCYERADLRRDNLRGGRANNFPHKRYARPNSRL